MITKFLFWFWGVNDLDIVTITMLFIVKILTLLLVYASIVWVKAIYKILWGT